MLLKAPNAPAPRCAHQVSHSTASVRSTFDLMPFQARSIGCFLFLHCACARLAGVIMFSTSPLVTFCHYQSCENDILKTMELILMQIRGARARNDHL